MKQLLHVIHVEDSLEDSELVQLILKTNGIVCEVARVETREELTEVLRRQECDLILSDCTLPRFHGLEALQLARDRRPDIPFIFVSGTIGEETAISSLQNGATDYVLKQRLSRLVPAIRRAMTEAEGQKARRAMEAQLSQARKLETIGTFAGGIVHDFRNLLQLLKLNINELATVANEPAEVGEIAERLNRATNRGCEIVEELMVFARKTEAHREPINMAAQIRETARLAGAGLPSNISLSLRLAEDLPPIPADASQVERILTNLIGNARDAMPEGGSIAICSDLVRLIDLPADLWPVKDVRYLRIKVIDTGVGMDRETQSRAFEPFFTTKPYGKGTGLGLSVVFGLMEAHQGFIDLSSRVGEGTTFALFFPLAAGTDVAPEKIKEVSPTELTGASG